MSQIAHSLYRETEAAKTLLGQMADILGDDEEAKADLVEGETNLFEAIARTVQRIGEDEASAAGIEEYCRKLLLRRERIQHRILNARTALAIAMEQAGKKSMETAYGTVSLRACPRNAVVIEEAELPSEFWKPQPPKLDKAALTRALKAGAQVSGAQLSNGGSTVSISR